MKKFFLIGVFALAFVSCKKENAIEAKVAEVPMPEVKVKRYDKAFFEAKPEDLPKLKAEYPELFPAGTEDTIWLSRMKEPFLLKLKGEVDKKYPDLDGLEEDLQVLFQHIKYYYPDFKTPKVVTLVTEDEDAKAMYIPDVVAIPLSHYLGKDHEVYKGIDKYLVVNFEPSQILPDLVVSYAAQKVPPPTDRTFLSVMIYFGKKMYLKDVLLPEVSNADKMGYTEDQIKWSEANEEGVWQYFITNNLLFDTDAKLPQRFITPAPFSKFYQEGDNQTPGRLGIYIGWQIVRSYMENNNVTLQELLAKDANEIFDNSKYKPKK